MGKRRRSPAADVPAACWSCMRLKTCPLLEVALDKAKYPSGQPNRLLRLFRRGRLPRPEDVDGGMLILIWSKAESDLPCIVRAGIAERAAATQPEAQGLFLPLVWVEPKLKGFSPAPSYQMKNKLSSDCYGRLTRPPEGGGDAP